MIGGKIYASSIIDHVDRLDYVDYVADLRLTASRSSPTAPSRSGSTEGFWMFDADGSIKKYRLKADGSFVPLAELVPAGW